MSPQKAGDSHGNQTDVKPVCRGGCAEGSCSVGRHDITHLLLRAPTTLAIITLSTISGIWRDSRLVWWRQAIRKGSCSAAIALADCGSCSFVPSRACMCTCSEGIVSTHRHVAIYPCETSLNCIYWSQRASTPSGYPFSYPKDESTPSHYHITDCNICCFSAALLSDSKYAICSMDCSARQGTLAPGTSSAEL